MNRLKEVREGLLMTQPDLADKTGLTVATICRIERGQRKPRFQTQRRLARALKVSVAELEFNGTVDKVADDMNGK
jgi:transcriptional regulator with XRE-family HTH domain